MKKERMNILMIGDVVLSIDCIREMFCCDLTSCKGMCCVKGDAGAPITMQEAKEIESIVMKIWDDLAPAAQEKIRNQGICYVDQEGDLVTSIVNGEDCVFTCYNEQGVCQCAIQKAQIMGKINVEKPLSCSLYPLREKAFKGGLTGLNYHQWDICSGARCLGKNLKIPVYKYLRQPLIKRFGEDWYNELCEVAATLKKEGSI